MANYYYKCDFDVSTGDKFYSMENEGATFSVRYKADETGMLVQITDVTAEQSTLLDDNVDVTTLTLAEYNADLSNYPDTGA